MSTPPASAREVAFSALSDRRGNVTARLDALLAETTLTGPDRGLAAEIALGVVRRRATLDAVARAYLAAPSKRLPTAVTTALRIALYQMLFLDRVPDFAAVNEAVEQVRRHRQPKLAGVVNAVLRNVARELADPQPGAPPHAANVVPVAPAAWRGLGRNVLADPAAEPARYLTEAYSLPAVLAERWLARFGSLDAAAAVAAHADARAPQILRVNTLKADAATVLAALGEDGVEAVEHENGVSVALLGHVRVPTLCVVREGLTQPQDPTATRVVLEAAPKPGMKVLDFCAAPGTKTTHIAAMMENRGAITAVDVSPQKLARIEDGCRRVGVTIVTTHLADRAGELEPAGYDLVLADVPCSNTGVLARRAEARWRFREDRLAKLAADQFLIAAAAARFVRPGGRLVYSTCSIEPEENQQVARRLAGAGEGLALVREELIAPGGAEDPARWHDGGYFAIFHRAK